MSRASRRSRVRDGGKGAGCKASEVGWDRMRDARRAARVSVQRRERKAKVPAG